MIGEEELAMVHALQVQPRATWAELAAVLGCTATTASRRWEQLQESGTAWVNAVPGPQAAAFVAFVALRCAPGRRQEVAAALVGDPAAVTVEITAGSHDLLVEVITPGPGDFTRYLLDRVERLPGVVGSDVTVATTVVTEASRWRLDALDPGQSQALAHETAVPRSAAAGAAAAAARPPARHLTELDRRLLSELSRDGRMPWQQLAEHTGTSAATARRRCERLLAAGEATLRCDVAAPLIDRQVTVSLWTRVPATDLGGVARALATVPSVRFIATTAGTHNLLVTLWLRSVDEVHRLEVDLAARCPTLAVLERTIVLHSAKRMGRVLDADGRSSGTVPMGPWATSAPVRQEREGVS
ncbi:Lrp/AsnC family transcriptional regulator [Streptacidiphilus pinicola]|uniref:Lrp/AsnC family transcriptional regulator n=1 Tax=Streptacidiphilus pinicola TaxID=2219663 RepID=A0A2X0K6A4_9ACTN|nr:Lrp/AsnC family transcriptional regulator [Streptacidiphilus pinicola]RAG83099.1 Lrp/AsnC family transcriptional regulator [Streptacidiphilus pinicola]